MFEIEYDESEAFSLGQEACADGLDFKANPYNPMDPNHRRWLLGFKAPGQKILTETVDNFPTWKCPHCGFTGEPREYVYLQHRYEACPRCDRARRID